jgi:hypothetical protein
MRRIPMAIMVVCVLCLSTSTWAASESSAANVFVYRGKAEGNSKNFSVRNGQIIDPDGKPFIGRGINIADYAMSHSNNGANLLRLFPGINFIRLNCQGMPDGAKGGLAADTRAALNAFIAAMTKAKIVVEIEDHYTAFTKEGNTNGIPTGKALEAELRWYTNVANAFKGNRYVWLGTMNEPGSGYNLSDADKNNIALQQIAIYNAIRSTGNANPILLETGGGLPNDNYAGFRTPYLSSYADMKNVIWDIHFYGWIPYYSNDPTRLVNSLNRMVADAKSVPTADGSAPVIIGEYGNATNGDTPDANGTAVVKTVQASGYGSAAWTYRAGASDKLLATRYTLTPYGAEVAAFLAGHSTTGFTNLRP